MSKKKDIFNLIRQNLDMLDLERTELYVDGDKLSGNIRFLRRIERPYYSDSPADHGWVGTPRLEKSVFTNEPFDGGVSKPSLFEFMTTSVPGFNPDSARVEDDVCPFQHPDITPLTINADGSCLIDGEESDITVPRFDNKNRYVKSLAVDENHVSINWREPQDCVFEDQLCGKPALLLAGGFLSLINGQVDRIVVGEEVVDVYIPQLDTVYRISDANTHRPTVRALFVGMDALEGYDEDFMRFEVDPCGDIATEVCPNLDYVLISTAGVTVKYKSDCTATHLENDIHVSQDAPSKIVLSELYFRDKGFFNTPISELMIDNRQLDITTQTGVKIRFFLFDDGGKPEVKVTYPSYTTTIDIKND